jgi:hypothetical protein
MGGMVVINVLVSSAVDRGFEPRSDRHQNYKIKHVSFISKIKDLFGRNKDNVSRVEHGTRGLIVVSMS